MDQAKTESIRGFIVYVARNYQDMNLGAIHGTGLMTEEYTPKNCRLRTAQNIIKILILF